jgi:hypothetical protein
MAAELPVPVTLVILHTLNLYSSCVFTLAFVLK